MEKKSNKAFNLNQKWKNINLEFIENEYFLS